MSLLAERKGISTLEEPLNPYECAGRVDVLGPLVVDIFVQIQEQNAGLLDPSKSFILRRPSRQADDELWLALVIYASRAACHVGWRDAAFDKLLLKSDVDHTADNESRDCQRLLALHGDILERIHCYESRMSMSSVSVVAGGLLSGALSLSCVLNESPVGGPADLLAHEFSGWCAWLAGLGGLGGGLWGSVYTWSHADDASSVARKALVYTCTLVD
jgi:hypothetical protein